MADSKVVQLARLAAKNGVSLPIKKVIYDFKPVFFQACCIEPDYSCDTEKKFTALNAQNKILYEADKADIVEKAVRKAVDSRVEPYVPMLPSPVRRFPWLAAGFLAGFALADLTFIFCRMLGK